MKNHIFNSENQFFVCSCGDDALYFNKFNDEDEVYACIWSRKSNHHSLKHKLKYIWHIIKYGQPYGDEVVLDKETCREISKYLLKLHGD